VVPAINLIEIDVIDPEPAERSIHGIEDVATGESAVVGALTFG
jgi:hypothetical protein